MRETIVKNALHCVWATLIALLAFLGAFLFNRVWANDTADSAQEQKILGIQEQIDRRLGSIERKLDKMDDKLDRLQESTK